MSIVIQLPARDRIVGLLDADSFVEIGAMVHARNTDFNMAEKATPADGVITGYGTIEGKLVYVYSQDADVLQGSVGEMHAKKIVRIYDLALKTGAPVIGLIDCAGMRLQEASDALNAFGELYYRQTMASGVIPQIHGIFGKCGGGMAVMTALADFRLRLRAQDRYLSIHRMFSKAITESAVIRPRAFFRVRLPADWQVSEQMKKKFWIKSVVWWKSCHRIIKKMPFA